MTFTLTKAGESPRKIETPFTLKQWLSIHFGAWGFYQIHKMSPKEYRITNAFTGEIEYLIKR